MTSLQKLLDEIKPAIIAEENEEVSSKNTEFLNKIIANNVKRTVADIRSQSPKMKSLEENGDLKIVGAVYDMETGSVNFLD